MYTPALSSLNINFASGVIVLGALDEFLSDVFSFSSLLLFPAAPSYARLFFIPLLLFIIPHRVDVSLLSSFFRNPLLITNKLSVKEQ